MPTITTADGTEIFYRDWGSGQPVVFSHGWPLSSDDWDAQMMSFLLHGYRVIAHDRRGPRLPVRHAHHPGRGDQRRPARLHPGLTPAACPTGR
jgi:pimeloyl-ACP methyl ester carboxylesterase